MFLRSKSAWRWLWTNPWLRLIRPVQWTKNTVVLAALIFSREFNDPDKVWAAWVAVLAFCLVSSAGYILNDWMDIERDRHHPLKRARPLASGAIPVARALFLGGLMAMSSLILCLLNSLWLGVVVAAYAGLMTAYSLWLKRIVIVDVLVIAAGFLLRAIAGGIAVQVPISTWLMVCTVLLALFLGFSKRRNEILTLQEAALLYRSTLGAYTPRMLDKLIMMTASSTLIAYSVYSFTAESVPANNAMMITVPIVAFALFRYLFLVYGRALGDAPELLLFNDLPLFGTIVVWMSTVFAVFWLA